MDLQEAKEILITFNRWRRGEDVEPMLKPSDIGKAIDVAIQCLEDSLKLEKCTNCNEMVKMITIEQMCPECKC
jgi:hypothetical protein